MALQLPSWVPNLGPRTRRILRYVGFVMLALVTFVFALQATFPYHRVKDKIIEVLSPDYDVTIGEVERGIVPGRMYLNQVMLRSRPTKPSDPVTVFSIERLEVDVGLLALLGATASVDFEATIGAGTIEGNIALSKQRTEIHVEGTKLPSVRLPMRAALSNLPMSGTIGFELDLDLPNEKLKSGKVGPNWKIAAGSFEFRCPGGCTIGDGKSKLKLQAKNARSQAFAGDGTDFGTIKLDSILAKAHIKNGELEISKFEAKSPDVELHVELKLALEQDINQSNVTGCLRFKGKEPLREREPKTFDQISLTGARRGPDGLDHITLAGTMKRIRKLAKVCGTNTSDDDDDDDRPPSRPNLTIQPDDPVKPATPGSATPPTFNPPPPPAGSRDAGAGDAAVTVPVPGPEGEGDESEERDGERGRAGGRDRERDRPESADEAAEDDPTGEGGAQPPDEEIQLR